jgi:hypothetical protein
MNKKLKILLILVALLVIGFFSARYYAYHGGQRDVQSEEAAFTLKSKDIIAEFTSNVEAANKKYLEKPVAISGVLTSVNGKEVILDQTVNCNFSTPDATLKKDQTVTVKGRVVGYDDLLGELKLDQCSITK